MGDYGIKLSKPFTDATTAADSDLIFNSAWPSLMVGEVLTGTLDDIIPHSLDYPPLAVMYITQTNGKLTRHIPYSGPSSIRASTLDANFFTPAGAVVYIVCYKLDLTIDIEYETLRSDGVPTTYDPDYGIKLVKENEDINSQDLRDFILHSRCQAPLVLAVKTQDSTTGITTGVDGSGRNTTTLNYTNPYGYPAWVYGYVRNADGFYQPAPYSSQTYPELSTDGIDSELTYINGGALTDTGLTLVSLRDPMFAPNTITATY